MPALPVYTDHSLAIDALREIAESSVADAGLLLAADLLEMHDNKSLSLDNWQSATHFIEPLVRRLLNEPLWKINPNRA